MDSAPQGNALQVTASLLSRTGHADYEQRRQICWSLIANTGPAHKDEVQALLVNWREANAHTASGRKGAAAEIDQFVGSCDTGKAPSMGTFYHTLKELGVVPTYQERVAIRSITLESGQSYKPVSEWDQIELNVERVDAASRYNLSNTALRGDMLSRETWANLYPLDPAEHPYAIKKRIKPLNAIAYSEKPTGALAFSLYDVNFELNSYQMIHPNGDKRHLDGTKTSGLFYPASLIDGLQEAGTLIICAGNATACSIYEATGIPTISALDDGNLAKLAGAIAYNRNGPSWQKLERVILAGDGGTLAKLQKAAKALLYWSPDIEVKTVEAGTESNYDFNDLFVAEGIGAVKAKIASAEIYLIEEEASSPEGPKPFFISAPVLTKEPKPVNWVLSNIIEAGSLTLLFGPPGSGKSLIALDWGFCIPLGLDWHGLKSTQCPVAYFAAEGHSGLSRRLKALEHKYSLHAPAQLLVSTQPVDLLQPAQVENLGKELDSQGIKLVIIDTLHRSFTGNENDSQDMGRVFHNIDRYIRSTGIAVLIVHHSGHQGTERSRGSSAIRAAMDAEFQADRSETGVSLVLSHS